MKLHNIELEGIARRTVFLCIIALVLMIAMMAESMIDSTDKEMNTLRLHAKNSKRFQWVERAGPREHAGWMSVDIVEDTKTNVRYMVVRGASRMGVCRIWEK